jgi:hypothetical protein
MASPDPLRWHFAGIMMTVFLAALQARVGRIAPWWQVVAALPGTAAHELSHLVVALVTGGKPSGFSIIPRARDCRRSDGAVIRHWTLGSVTIANAGCLSAFPTGFAPLLLNVVAWYLFCHWFTWFPQSLSSTLGLYLVVSMLCSSSLPSTQDIRVAFSSLPGAILYLVLIAVCYLYRSEVLHLWHVAARVVPGGPLVSRHT